MFCVSLDNPPVHSKGNSELYIGKYREIQLFHDNPVDHVSITLCNAFVLNRRQALRWTNVDQDVCGVTEPQWSNACTAMKEKFFYVSYGKTCSPIWQLGHIGWVFRKVNQLSLMICYWSHWPICNDFPLTFRTAVVPTLIVSFCMSARNIWNTVAHQDGIFWVYQRQT